VTNIELRSLAPEYDQDHHQTYVSRLNAAVVDPRNKNVALTGRYGSGKSSILERFIDEQEKPGEKIEGRKKTQPKKTLRISINTLGPDDDEDLTNRIQKELVKQLVYRPEPGELRTSRFARAQELTWWRAGIDAAVVAVVIVGMLWLFGLRPDKNSFGTDSFLLPMIALFLLAFSIVWALRWYIGGRTVSQFSTGGASIAFEENTDSYFDKYLDELVAFFEATEPDIVVFEDLDRFDDPQIFDSLRELNTLVNASAHWQNRSTRPLRFVYAIKDSLFEKLGDKQRAKDRAGDAEGGEGDAPTPRDESKDTAAQAVERANRTKFFEIVIPVVPFLSHSNARDLFLKDLEKLKLPPETEIDRGLIDIVARHTTDMRLMINIGNEFVVYAERLLWVDETKRAPGITADRLFALVVYKNFHLADFEALPHRGSVLDTLEQSRRDLVDASITNLREERADLVRSTTRRRTQLVLATRLGQRLAVFLEASRMALSAAKADSAPLDVNGRSEVSFWQRIAQSDSVVLSFQHHSGHSDNVVFDREKIQLLFPEVANPDAWLDLPSQVDFSRLAEIDAEIAELRGASFQRLVEDGRYELNSRTFSTIIDETLPSQLARDLVTRGYLDRYYAEYASVFYGNFLGVDVANFFRNSVWPNEMDPQFPFSTDGGVANVLAQAPADFLRTRSALNIEIVDHLMDTKASSSGELIDFMARPNNTDAHQFLKTYLNTPGTRSEQLASLLAAKPWPRLFSFIASQDTIDADETNVQLLSAALMSAQPANAYELDDNAQGLVARLHARIPAFKDSQPGASTDILFSFLIGTLPSIPSLRALSPELQRLAVSAKRYELSADNIRAAASLTDEAAISADNLIEQPVVWEYCIERIEDYLDLIQSDEHTTWSCMSPEVLAEVVNAQYEDWTTEQLETFLDASSGAAALPNVKSVERETWQSVVEAFKAVPNVTNLEAYTTGIGVDVALARLLTDEAGEVVDILGLEGATDEQLRVLIPRLLNADGVLMPLIRVLLVNQLLASPESPGLDITEIEANSDELLAELLRASLVEDSQAVFDHFSAAGWLSIGPALGVSANAAMFITPELIAGHAAAVVSDAHFPTGTRRTVLERLTEFAPNEGEPFLLAAATAARTLGVTLSAEALALIAPSVRDPEDVVWQLSQQSGFITAIAVAQTLGLMPGDFAGFAGPSGHKFDVPDTASLTAVLDQLKADGAITFQPGRQPRGRWKLRIV
jgi:hypothetical protein